MLRRAFLRLVAVKDWASRCVPSLELAKTPGSACRVEAGEEGLKRPVQCEAADREEPEDGFASQEATPELLRLCRRERPHAGLGGATPQPALQRGGVARERLERGLRAWSSPTFTVFTHVCLRAERAIGRLELGRGGPAREPRKSRAILGLCLSEGGGNGACEPVASPGHHRGSRLRGR